LTLVRHGETDNHARRSISPFSELMLRKKPGDLRLEEANVNLDEAAESNRRYRPRTEDRYSANRELDCGPDKKE
jgi:hypothetical protein